MTPSANFYITAAAQPPHHDPIAKKQRSTSARFSTSLRFVQIITPSANFTLPPPLGHRSMTQSPRATLHLNEVFNLVEVRSNNGAFGKFYITATAQPPHYDPIAKKQRSTSARFSTSLRFVQIITPSANFTLPPPLGHRSMAQSPRSTHHLGEVFNLVEVRSKNDAFGKFYITATAQPPHYDPIAKKQRSTSTRFSTSLRFV
jgi:hypothetical protein